MKSLNSMMESLHNSSLAALFIRIAVGVIFINAGWIKVNNMDMVLEAFGSMGIPAFLAYFVAYAEFIGGIALVIGLFTRYIGVIFAIIMVVAIWKVHFVNGFSLQNGGYEYNFVLLLSSLALVTLGGGKYGISGFCCKK